MFNTFGIEPALKILELKVNKFHWPILKPFLIFLNYITNDELVEIEMSKYVIERLRRIRHGDC